MSMRSCALFLVWFNNSDCFQIYRVTCSYSCPFLCALALITYNQRYMTSTLLSVLKGLITQVVNASGCVPIGGMTSDWVLLLTRGHAHTPQGCAHTPQGCAHTPQCSALAWSLHITSHTTPFHLTSIWTDSINAYIPLMKQDNNLCLKRKYYHAWEMSMVP